MLIKKLTAVATASMATVLVTGCASSSTGTENKSETPTEVVQLTLSTGMAVTAVRWSDFARLSPEAVNTHRVLRAHVAGGTILYFPDSGTYVFATHEEDKTFQTLRTVAPGAQTHYDLAYVSCCGSPMSLEDLGSCGSNCYECGDSCGRPFVVLGVARVAGLVSRDDWA